MSFQEYLAALEIGGLSEKQQIAKVVAGGKLYRRDWRQTMELLGGVLLKQGESKVEGFFQAVLGRLGKRPTLWDQVQCGTLLQAMMRDLSRMGYQPKTPDYDRAVKASMRIEQALSHLAPNLRSAVVLRDIEDLSCEEIAEILDISLGTVKSRILRGREAMRKQLAGRAARPRQKA